MKLELIKETKANVTGGDEVHYWVMVDGSYRGKSAVFAGDDAEQRANAYYTSLVEFFQRPVQLDDKKEVLKECII